MTRKNERRWLGLLTAIMLAVLPLAATAAEGPAKKAGDIMVRLRSIGFMPDESGAANDGTTPIGGAAAVDDQVIPELDITYFFTRNIAMELILATTRHSIAVGGSSLGDVDLGEVSLLPPVLTLQYHFDPIGRFSPYIGAGLNYTIFFNANKGRGGGGVSVADIDYSNSVGYAFQIGMDIHVRDRWYANIDLKKVFVDTDINVNNGVVRANGTDLDPWVLGIGFGYRF
jgi:outer membrane protein